MAEDTKALARKFFEGMNAGRIDETVDELLADDFVEHEQNPPGFPETGSDKEDVKVFFRMFAQAFDGLHMDLEDVLGEGDHLAVRSRMKGTHKGEFMGIPPSGRPIDIEVIDWITVRDGKATEHWGVTDVATLMAQIGAIEGAPAA
jgi:steroid delta-isomerase-like uncharacterized protein